MVMLGHLTYAPWHLDMASFLALIFWFHISLIFHFAHIFHSWITDYDHANEVTPKDLGQTSGIKLQQNKTNHQLDV